MMFQPLEEMLNQSGLKHYHLSNIILSATVEAGLPSDKIKPFTLVFKTAQVRVSYLSSLVEIFRYYLHDISILDILWGSLVLESRVILDLSEYFLSRFV